MKQLSSTSLQIISFITIPFQSCLPLSLWCLSSHQNSIQIVHVIPAIESFTYTLCCRAQWWHFGFSHILHTAMIQSSCMYKPFKFDTFSHFTMCMFAYCWMQYIFRVLYFNFPSLWFFFSCLSLVWSLLCFFWFIVGVNR